MQLLATTDVPVPRCSARIEDTSIFGAPLL